MSKGNVQLIAEAVMSIESIKKAVKEHFLKDIDKQCQNLCVHKKGTPSVLKVNESSCVDALKSFTWEKVMIELRDRVPDVLDVMTTICKQPSVTHVPAVCMGYAILMYQRNSKLGLLQKLLTVMMGSGGCSRRVRTI